MVVVAVMVVTVVLVLIAVVMMSDGAGVRARTCVVITPRGGDWQSSRVSLMTTAVLKPQVPQEAGQCSSINSFDSPIAVVVGMLGQLSY